jgi:hypothetical protein
VSALSGAIDSFEHLLLEQDGAETRVEGTNTLGLEDLAETTDQTVGELGVGDETDTGGLERAESDVSDELSAGSGTEVDGGAVVGGSLVAESVDGLLLEELVTTELEGTLEEVTSGGGTETSPDGAGALVGDDLAEATDEAGVVGDGVKLDAGLDAAWSLARSSHVIGRSCRAAPEKLQGSHWRASLPLGDGHIHIDGGKSTVSDGAADGTSESEARVESSTGGRVRRRHGSKLGLGGVDLAGAGGSWGRSGRHCERRWTTKG